MVIILVIIIINIYVISLISIIIIIMLSVDVSDRQTDRPAASASRPDHVWQSTAMSAKSSRPPAIMFTFPDQGYFVTLLLAPMASMYFC